MSLPKRLCELQQVDFELREQQGNLDRINRQLGESEALVESRSSLTLEKARLAELERKQKDLEWETGDLENRMSQLNEKLYGGRVKNPKELFNLERELEDLKVKLNRKEDDLLEIMTEVEVVGDKAQVAAKQVEEVERRWQREQETLAQKQVEVDSQLLALSQRRGELASQISSEVLSIYEQVKQRKGRAVARVEQGRCGGCLITLPLSEWQRARAGELVRCGNCGRILFLE